MVSRIAVRIHQWFGKLQRLAHDYFVATDVKKLPSLLFPGVAVAWLVWLCLAAVLGLITGWEQLGQFGDVFGALNALFTALAFAAVFWSGRMQGEELILQRKELKAQRDELKETRAVVAKQTFEATFFRMIELFRQIEAQIQANSARVLHGQEALARLAELVTERIYINCNGRENQPCDFIGEVYRNEIYEAHEGSLGPYFRSLYHLYKFLDGQLGLSEPERNNYANVVRGQLSRHSLAVLAVNGCCIELASEMRPLMIKYRLLKHLPRERLYHLIRHCYPAETFEGRPSAQSDCASTVPV